MQIFTLLGAVASAYVTEVTIDDVTYSGITAVDNSCMKVKQCAALDKKIDVTHWDFEKCLTAASTECEFTAKVNNIFVDEYILGDTGFFESCSTADKIYGINTQSLFVLKLTAHGDVKIEGPITVTMNKMPEQGDVKVKTGIWSFQCADDNFFNNWLTDLHFTGETANETYILTINVADDENRLLFNGLYFRGDTDSEFQKADFSKLKFETNVKGKGAPSTENASSTDDAFSLFASSALVSLTSFYVHEI